MKNYHVSKQILFLVGQQLGLVPGQRFRFEQYLGYLKEHGFECHISPLFSQSDAKVFYKQGKFFKKVLILLRSAMKRFKDLKNIQRKKYDAVFIYRDAYITGTTYFERKIKKAGVPIVYDFDDAIWLNDVSDANKQWKWLKNPEKISKIIKISDLVIAGNEYLKNFSSQYNTNTLIIPTTIDTELYTMKSTSDNGVITIGWSGSITTIKHFRTAEGFLSQLKKKYGNMIRIVVIGDGNYTNDELGIQGKWWKPDTEIQDLNEFDIGIMPLPDDEWSKGKCGLKGLQYMALGIATIMSPVGVNNEIIRDGVNGFLASSDDEWVQKLSMLIESPHLRQQLGREGRKTVENYYSVSANKHLWLSAFQSVVHE